VVSFFHAMLIAVEGIMVRESSHIAALKAILSAGHSGQDASPSKWAGDEVKAAPSSGIPIPTKT